MISQVTSPAFVMSLVVSQYQSGDQPCIPECLLSALPFPDYKPILNKFDSHKVLNLKRKRINRAAHERIRTFNLGRLITPPYPNTHDRTVPHRWGTPIWIRKSNIHTNFKKLHKAIFTRRLMNLLSRIWREILKYFCGGNSRKVLACLEVGRMFHSTLYWSSALWQQFPFLKDSAPSLGGCMLGTLFSATGCVCLVHTVC